MGCFRSNLPVGVWAEPSATWVSILCPQGSGRGKVLMGRGRECPQSIVTLSGGDLMVMNILIVK